MKLTNKTKGVIDVSKIVTNLVFLIIGVIVIFYIVGNSASSITDSAGNISGSGLPLAGLFSSSGVVLLVVMAGIFIAIVGMAFSLYKRGK